MQDITPQLPEGANIIESYGAGGFKIAGQRFNGSIFLSPKNVFNISTDDIENISEIDQEKILNAIVNDVEILLIGYGSSSNFLKNSFEKKIKEQKVNVEYMDTGAAARTYNVLLTEERKVAVVMIAV